MSRKQIRINTDKEHSRPPNEPEARLTYKNTEGYADPTCFYALCNVMRDEKRRKQRERQNHSRQNSRFPNRTRDAPGKKRFNTQVIHYDERGGKRMNEKDRNTSTKPRLVTAEAVRAGHPDKFCDQFADMLLDEHLKGDPCTRAAIEVMATDAKILVAGEVTSKASVDVEPVLKRLCAKVGYTMDELSTDGELALEVRLNRQSPDIAQAVVDGEDLGAGDQGIMVGYATDETPERMPLPVVLAQSICRGLDESRIPWLKPDGKAQVTVVYQDDAPVAVSTVVVSVQHDEDVPVETIRREVKELIRKVIPEKYLRPGTRLLINPSGRFVLGGPAADTGLTGRKLAVDAYGPVARIGGGALSGKDPTKVDRTGAYAARWVARSLVDAGLAKCCEVQIAYAIGRAMPVSVDVDTFGTGIVPDGVLRKAIRRTFDLRPSALIRDLKLRRPIYAPLAAYGHFGRADTKAPWEETEANETALLIATLCCLKES